MALPKADTVLKNGRVFESLESGFREAVALWCGRVLATGDWREIEALVGPDTRVIDLRGRAVVPGFNDAHQHLIEPGKPARPRAGAGRRGAAGASYPMRAWFDAGLHPAASSDAPVSDTSAMANLYTMVTRARPTAAACSAPIRRSAWPRRSRR